jgi:hypothetical protein
VAGIVRPLTNLHALRRLEADMGWLLTEGVLSIEAARGIPDEIRCVARWTVSCQFSFLADSPPFDGVAARRLSATNLLFRQLCASTSSARSAQNRFSQHCANDRILT